MNNDKTEMPNKAEMPNAGGKAEWPRTHSANLPEGLVVKAEATGGGCGGTGDVVRAPLRSLRPGEVVTVTVGPDGTGAALETSEDEARPYQAPQTTGLRYSTTTFKDNGKPILLNADGTRSIFCDVDDGPDDADGIQPEDTAHLDCPACGGSGHIDDASAAARDVLAERRRQQEVKGRTPESDDEWVCDELAALACAYIMPPGARGWDASSTGYGDTLVEAMVPPDWQFRSEDRRSDLRKGAALVLAELERLDRAEQKGGAA